MKHIVFKRTSFLKNREFEWLVKGEGVLMNTTISWYYTYNYINCIPEDLKYTVPQQSGVVFESSIADESFK